jgi:hypothetical protein
VGRLKAIVKDFVDLWARGVRVCIVPKFVYFVVNHYDVIVTYHYILNRRFDGRVLTVLDEFVSRVLDTVHPNVRVLLGQVDDIKAADSQ